MLPLFPSGPPKKYDPPPLRYGGWIVAGALLLFAVYVFYAIVQIWYYIPDK